ncbi:MAG TPA: DUF2630 family protein [Sporichthya sp.]|nr:DUF2630 family protein [Sporichthya sp.]
MAEDLIKSIDALVDEEHELRSREGGMSDEDKARLREVEVRLDQCWDLLRQRRARREFGEDPEQAHTRPPEVVERYLQ